MKSVIERLLPHRRSVQWTGHAVLVAVAYLLAFYIDGEFFVARAGAVDPVPWDAPAAPAHPARHLRLVPPVRGAAE